jgi:hypothetical protein
MKQVKRSLSVKNMTLDQIKRIQQNNYCSEHDRTGKQFDYEAMGYRDEIDARYWELVAKKNFVKNDMNKSVEPEKTSVTATDISKEIESIDIQLSVLKAFNKWRFISNEITLKFL